MQTVVETGDRKQADLNLPFLFSPLTIRRITFPNRIVVSPMCEYSSVDGFSNDWHLVHLGSRAVGGAGLVIAEATAVSPEGRITYADLGIWKDAHIENLKRITTFIRAQGSVPGIQLAHAGRKASCEVPWLGGRALEATHENGWVPVAPSAVPFHANDPIPHELSVAEIREIQQKFVAAAERALAAGFEVVEIHGAHGYLIHEFLSPISNLRNDEYGGRFENRTRFVLEVVQGVRRVWPAHLPLFLRISATDWIEGGWDVDESVKLSARVKELGVDLVDCSSGALAPHAKMQIGPGYQVPFAARIRKETGVLTGAVGLITDAQQAEGILLDESADLILLAREMLRDPYFPMHAAQLMGVPVEAPKQYFRAFPDGVVRGTAGSK